jgi:hypothetical protein
MRKELRVLDEKNRIISVTVQDERFYSRESVNPSTGLPEFIFVPSVTYILTAMAKGKGFENWLKTQGENADEVKLAAGNKGSRIHRAVDTLINGGIVGIDAEFPDSDDVQKPLSAEEYEALMHFAAWHQEAKPEYIATDFLLWGDGYAGVADILCRIGGELYLVDLKTGQGLYESYTLQVSAYKHARPITLEDPPDLLTAKLAILQVGNRRIKKGYKFTEVEDKYPVFRAVQTVFNNEHGTESPRQIDLPMEIKL